MLGVLLCFLFPFYTSAQCGAGYQQVTLDWDNLDYFSYTGNYTSGNGYLSSNTVAQTQTFAFGTQRLVIGNNYAAAGNLGEDATHTGDAGSYGIGNADVHFMGDGKIVLTFDNEVQNLKFSMYDIDRNQAVSFAAANALAVPQNVTLTKLGTSILTVLLNGTALANAKAANSNVANNVADASMNIDIAGPVKTLTITVSATSTNGSEDGSFWLSNIIACSAGTFPAAYYNISKPFTGQPGYVLHAFDKSVYVTNPANGATELLFTDAAGAGNINSMGYDPYNRVLYYVYSLTGSASSNRVIKKYDVNTKTISTILADVNTIGIPTASSGVESGAGAFYNGSFFLGIETSNNGRTSARESVVWRIDFNGSNVPYRACQVFAMPVDDGGGNLMHDWSDFVISNGILYDFDGAFNTSNNYPSCGTTTLQRDIYQFNMITAANVNYHNTTFTPGQPAVDWAGNIYNMFAATGTCAATTTPYIALYNTTTGAIGTTFNLTSTPAYTPAIPSLGDAGEAFRPLVDFGDAPASYDPVSGDPAVHELDASLRLGSSESEEWVTRGQTALADQDTYEDGLGAAPSLLNFNGTVTYTVSNISVYNNTGANATLIGWLDYNMNGVFDAGEGRSITVATGASAQLKNLTWSGITVPNTAAVRTFLRLRLTRASNGMATTNMNGYMPDGEVEDYPVLLGISLQVSVASFDVQKGNGKTADLKWVTAGNILENAAFDIERSYDGQQWLKIGAVNTAPSSATADRFSYTDENPLSGKSFYRIKMISKDGTSKYSETKSIYFSYLKGKPVISPNPVSDFVNIQLVSEKNASLSVLLYDCYGKLAYAKNVPVITGNNNFRLTEIKSVSAGLYYIKLNIGEDVFTDKLVINK